MTTRWVFEERKKKDKKRDPMEAEFFTGDEDEDDVSGRTDGLVREAVSIAAARSSFDRLRMSGLVANFIPTL